MRRLNGKVAIVTGASRGIGAAIARRLGQEGARVAINFLRSEQAAAQVAEEIRGAGGQALLVRADVADEAQLQRLFEEVDRAFGRLDILVNNAGQAQSRPLEQVDRAHYQQVLATNLWGPVECCRLAVRRLRAGGRIINVTSLAARMSLSGFSMYSAAKAGVEALTRVLATELGARGITVNAVAPGLVETDMAVVLPEAARLDLVGHTPLGRPGQPADVADLVAFLASEDSHWLTGQTLNASGGYTMY
jgi:3-oxoacyl-[acyl-carrier protein] reductase